MTRSDTQLIEAVPARGRLAAPSFLRLVSVDPTRNRFRFYAFAWQRTLWGDWAISCSWGRIGSIGRSRIAYLGEVQGVPQALRELVEHRIRRGYTPGGLPPDRSVGLIQAGVGSRCAAYPMQE